MSENSKKQHITKLKNSQFDIQRLFAFDNKVQNKICDCGRYVQFNKYKNIVTQELKKKVEQATTCQYRYCPLCNYYRICSVSPQMQRALEEQQQKGNKILFLTLTIPNCQYSDLRQKISLMNKAFKRLTRLDFFNNVEAWIRTTEVTFNTKNEAHPHFHIALAVNENYFKKGNYKTTREWSKLWTKAYKSDKQLIVDIRKAYKSKKHSSRDLDIQSTVKELAKYCIKSTDLKRVRTPGNMEEIFNQLKGLRFIATSQNIKLSEDSNDKLNLQEWDLIESIIMKYYPDMRKYLEFKKIAKI
ncbi:protein rep [Francisella philomiragia]|uniref:Protein rep n=1 Tax=Francisella philomiragia TaxID=28110 RepID=A0A0B6D7U3_9GAMM|nr:protein rep [Francisella philomiragia]AJI54352.1 replication family protein [Francisella philomiragia]MBK2255726.1 protein rep [Francisella philomiragia]MBK2259604.1 protein rep [Francisella philomiragia]MBK2268396.1 protein rep [Francisella philomiragia]MBK2274037.1 protein rep [Francisella philomiragia]